MQFLYPLLKILNANYLSIFVVLNYRSHFTLESPARKEMEASLENATLDESEVGLEVIEDDAVNSETEEGSNESMDGSTVNASSHSRSNEPKMWYQQLVLTYFEFPEFLKLTPREEIPENKNIHGKCLKCGKRYSGRPFSTSNWQRHLKVSCISLLYKISIL